MTRQRTSWLLTAAATVAFAVEGCGSPPAAPTPTPPVVNNTPPIIQSMKVSADRVEADHELDVTASVTDAEVAPETLTYMWSASPANGTFTGSGPVVRWRAPTQQKTPDLYTLTLTVTETFLSAGLPKQNQVSSTVQVPYNDSPAEVRALAEEFYKDFGNSSVSAAACVRNFSDSCRGKQEELANIQGNRDRTDYRIVGSTLSSSPHLTFDSGMTRGTFLQPCTFEDVSTTTGKRQRVSGDCYLSTVYEQWRWWLCDSHFFNGMVTSESLRYRVPGRLMLP
jgi:hypothetical protein